METGPVGTVKFRVDMPKLAFNTVFKLFVEELLKLMGSPGLGTVPEDQLPAVVHEVLTAPLQPVFCTFKIRLPEPSMDREGKPTAPLPVTTTDGIVPATVPPFARMLV